MRGGIIPKLEWGCWSAENLRGQDVDGGYFAVTWFGRLIEVGYGSPRRFERNMKRMFGSAE